MTNGKVFREREEGLRLLLTTFQAGVLERLVADHLGPRLNRVVRDLETVGEDLGDMLPAEVRVMVEAAAASLGKAIDFVDASPIPF